MFVFLHPLYIRDISCFCNVTAEWGSIEKTASKVVSSLYLKTHENFYAKMVRGQKVDKLENCDDRTSYFSTEKVMNNLETECIEIKDTWLPSSSSLPAPSPSSKQLGQCPRTQPGTQKKGHAQHHTAQRYFFSFLVSRCSYSPTIQQCRKWERSQYCNN